MFSSHCDQFISLLLCPILTHCDPRKSSIFPIFVIFVIYRPRFCPFVHFVIVLYCIYAFWVVSTREIKLRSTISTVGLHWSQLKFFSPECVEIWRLSSPLVEKEEIHWVQGNGFSPEGVSRCLLRFLAVVQE